MNEEYFVLGLENKEMDEIYYQKLFESYGFPTFSMKQIHKGSIINLSVIFKNEIKEEMKTLVLPGVGEYEITKSKERMEKYTEEKEKDHSFPFIK